MTMTLSKWGNRHQVHHFTECPVVLYHTMHDHVHVENRLPDLPGMNMIYINRYPSNRDTGTNNCPGIRGRSEEAILIFWKKKEIFFMPAQGRRIAGCSSTRSSLYRISAIYELVTRAASDCGRIVRTIPPIYRNCAPIWSTKRVMTF